MAIREIDDDLVKHANKVRFSNLVWSLRCLDKHGYLSQKNYILLLNRIILDGRKAGVEPEEIMEPDDE